MTSHIKTLLSPFLQSSQQSWKLSLLQKWPEIMGNLAQQVSIEKIYDDTLVLSVGNSSWLQELYLMEQTILTTINQNLDQPRFKQLRFKQKDQSMRTKRKKEKKVVVERPQSFPLSAQEKKALQDVNDPCLRTALESFLVRCHREKKR